MYQFSYADVQSTSVSDAKDRERELLTRSIDMLSAAAAAGQDSMEAIEALNFTNRVWTIFVEDLGSSDNALPKELRANLISIGLWLLREAERVLMPEGQLVILGFNSLSLWGARQAFGKMTGRPFVPAAQDLIAFTRIKDWLKLLGFELERGRFGCYRPPLAHENWLTRFAFMEAAGDRWWPIFGAAYMVTAVKRVRGMRLVGAIKAKKPVLAPGLAPAATHKTPNPRI